MGARKLQGSASEKHGMLKTKKPACASEGSGILKAKKEALAAVRLLRFQRISGRSDLWMDHWREMKAKEAAEAAGPVKKRKKVVKQRLPKALIDHMTVRPFGSAEGLAPAQLAKRPLEFRQFYQLTTFVVDKFRDYEQALIRQYNAQGYAEDETEVTDSEDDDATVVEN